jgi:sugar phosphate isomerase/epimerase
MKSSLFTVSYAGLWGQAALSLEDSVRKAADLGYKGVELMCKRPHLYPFDADDTKISGLKSLIKSLGLEVSCMAAYTNFTAGAESREVPLSDLQVSYVKKVGELAARLDCGLIRVFTGYENPSEPFNEQWRACARAVQACCDAVREYGVTIGVQNHHDIAVDTKAMLELYCDVDRPNLGLMIDAWSMFLRGEDIESSLRSAAGKQVFSTVADYVILPRYAYNPGFVNYEKREPALVRAVQMGKGDMDYKRYFNALKKNGYDGWVSYETCSPLRSGGSLENIDLYAKTFLEFMSAEGFIR